MNLISNALRMARVKTITLGFTCHQHVYLRMEWSSHSAFTPSRRASPHFGGYSFPVPHRAGGRVGLGGWLHTKVVCSPEDGHPSQYPIDRITDSAASGIKLTTTESQVW